MSSKAAALKWCCLICRKPAAVGRRTLGQAIRQQAVLHADETPVQMLSPGKGKTHRACLRAYTSTQFSELRAVVYDFAESRAGAHARTFLKGWHGKLVCDDYCGYKSSFQHGITEIGCAAHARRKFFELHANHSRQVEGQALPFFTALHDIEREAAAWMPTNGSGFDVSTRQSRLEAQEF